MAVCAVFAAGEMLWGLTADEVTQKTGISGGLCSFPRAGAGDDKLALELAQRPSFVVHLMSQDDAAVTRIRGMAETEGVLGRSLYVENGAAQPLPFADRLVDLLVVTDLRDKDLTPELKSEWLRVLGPQRGTALVGRSKASGSGLSRSALTKWTSDLPLAKVLSDDTGVWVLLRTARPAGSDSWSHRCHGAENAQVSSDTTFQAPFLTQWWGMPRQEGFWGTTVVSCNGRMFTIRGSRNAGDEGISLTARGLNNGIVLWQKRLRQAAETIRMAHGGYIPGRSCVVATDDSLFLVKSNTVVRLNAETGEERECFAGPKPGGQVKWIACSGKLLAVLAGEADVILPIAYQTVAANPVGRDLAVYDVDTKKKLWSETLAGDVDERAIAMRDNQIYCLVQGVGVVCRDARKGRVVWTNPDPSILSTFRTPDQKAIGQMLVSQPALMALDNQVLLLRANWATNLVALSRADGTTLWKKRHGPSGRTFTAVPVNGVWLGGDTGPIDLKTGEPVKGAPPFISSGCGPTTCTSNYLITCFGKVLDMHSNTVVRNEDIKSPCDVGSLVSEGIMVTMPSECGCYYEMKGYRALASAGSINPNTAPDWKTRLTVCDAREPAALEVAASDWPTYRHDPMRSAASPVTVGLASNVIWRWKTAGAISFTNAYVFAAGPYLKPDFLATAPVAAAGRVWFASYDGTVHCLDAATGKEQWSFGTGNMVFASPTVADGRVLVGGGDGRVYCLDATTGRSLWRLQAAPVDRRLFWFGHLISTWPVIPGVVVQNGVAYTVAGYQKDNGIHAYAINPKTGQVIWETDDASRGVRSFGEGLESLGDIALGNGKMWVCGQTAGYFVLTNGAWRGSGGGSSGCEIGMMDKWVFHGGRRLSETQDALCNPLGGSGFGVTSDEEKPQGTGLCDALPAWDADLTMCGTGGSLYAIPSAKLLTWLSEKNAAQDAYNKAPKDAKPKLVNWPDLKSWATDRMTPVSFALTKDQLVVACSDRRTHRVSGYSRADGAKMWTASLPEQPAMNRMALDRDGHVLVALCDGSIICLGR